MANNVGRLITSPGPFIVGVLVVTFGSYALATAVISGTVLFSLFILFAARETLVRKQDVGPLAPDDKQKFFS